MRLDFGKSPVARCNLFVHRIPRLRDACCATRPRGQAGRMKLARTMAELQRGVRGIARASSARWRSCRRWARCMTVIARWCGLAWMAVPRSSRRSSSIRCSSLPTRTCRAIRATRRAISPRWRRAAAIAVWLPDVATMYPPGDATTIDVAGPADSGRARRDPGISAASRRCAPNCSARCAPIAPISARRTGSSCRWCAAWSPTCTCRCASSACRRCVNRTDWRCHRAIASCRRLNAWWRRGCSPPCKPRPGTWRAAIGAELALRSARTALEQAGFEMDYLALVDGATMRPLEATADNARLIAAARLGSVRLIDNLPA